MTLPDLPWGTIHASAYLHTATLLRWTTATPRPHGALRYRCPVNRGYVVLTDDETLAQLSRPRARMRCPSCGETHLLAQARDGAPSAAIVGPEDRP